MKLRNPIVLAIRLEPNGQSSRDFTERVRAFVVRAEARGATLVACADVAVLRFAADSLDDALSLLATSGEDRVEGEAPWAAGLAQGALDLLFPDGSRGEVSCGAAVTRAVELARLARAGEVLTDRGLEPLLAGELRVRGARAGEAWGVKVSGRVVDDAFPWRRRVVEQVDALASSPLLGGFVPEDALPPEGSCGVLRGEAGAGGTRALAEVALFADESITLTPAGSGLEPLAALRRALLRAAARGARAWPKSVALSFERLRDGEPITLDEAVETLVATLGGREGALILVDDAGAIDFASLEACAAAVAHHGARVLARVEGEAPIPLPLGALPVARAVALAPLADIDARTLAQSITRDGLSDELARRYARLSGGSPLGLVEALSSSLERGDLLWHDGALVPRARRAGRGRPRDASAWVTQRFAAASVSERHVLAALATLGGEARTARVKRLLEAAAPEVGVEGAIVSLLKARWITVVQRDWVALASRTHLRAAWNAADAGLRDKLAARLVDAATDDHGLGRTEAVLAAARAGDRERAELWAREAIAACRATGSDLALRVLRRAYAAVGVDVSAPAAVPSPLPPPASTRASASAIAVPPPPASLASRSTQATDVAGGASLEEPELAPPLPPVAPPRPRLPSYVPAEEAERSESAAAEPSPPLPPVAPPPPKRPSHAAAAELEVARPEPSSALPPVAPPPPRRPSHPPPDEIERALLEPAPVAAPWPGSIDDDLQTRERPIVAPPVPSALEVDLSLLESSGEIEPPTLAQLMPTAEPLEEGALVCRAGVDAILDAEHEALDEWMERAAALADRSELVEHVLAVAEAHRGDPHVALGHALRLRAAASTRGAVERCRASLTLALALHSAGRPEEALLEGLDALGRARRAGERDAERASLALLAKVYSARGDAATATSLAAAVGG